MFDPDTTSAATALFNEAVAVLEKNGWIRIASEDNPWYWWRHAEQSGVFSIGAALRFENRR